MTSARVSKMADHRKTFIGSSYSFHFLIVGLLCFSFVLSSADRKIKITEVNCTVDQDKRCQGQNYSIIHVVAESSDKSNAIHYLWSTFVSPTVIVAYFEGKNNVKLQVNWTEVLNKKAPSSKAITFSLESDYLVAFVIPAIYEFADPKDKLYYDEETSGDSIRHLFEKVKWEKPEVDYRNNLTTFKGNLLGGTVILEFSASYHEGRGKELPHELFTSNSSMFTFTLDQLKEFNKTKNTRLIFEILALKTDGDKICVTAERSLDDEHTPGVFKTIVVGNTATTGNSFFAWKPVAYTNEKRSFKNQVPSYMYLSNKHVFISEKCQHPPPSSLGHAGFFSIAQLLEKITLSNGMNVSFGQQKDGWYEETNYLSWSGAIGFGSPASDSFSAVVWIIIFVGFGTPLLVTFVAVIYIIVKRFKRKGLSSNYGRIN